MAEPEEQAFHYVAVINPGPMIMVRIPWPFPLLWEKFLAALTPVMRSHGLRRKDISRIEGIMLPPDEATAEDIRFRKRLERAFDGDASILPEFWLYEFRKGKVVLVREGSLKQ